MPGRKGKTRRRAVPLQRGGADNLQSKGKRKKTFAGVGENKTAFKPKCDYSSGESRLSNKPAED